MAVKVVKDKKTGVTRPAKKTGVKKGTKRK